MSAYNLNIFVENINRSTRIQFSTHESGIFEIVPTILVAPRAHDSAHECAHASVSGNLNTGLTLCERQRELRSKCSQMEKGEEKNFLISCFM
jgi:hypothetical protein